jgi:DNA-binding transcriptional LysR family regulator
MLDWQDLRHFVALADTGTLLGAARSLGVEHATVARRVAALESQLDQRLVDRRSGRYVLTTAGEDVAATARRMLAETLSLERTLLAGSRSAAVEVAVSTPPVIASHLIAPRLAQFHREHPTIQLQLLGESHAASLTRREADIVLRLSRPDDNTLVVRRAGAVTYRAYAAPAYLAAHPPAERAFIGLSDDLDGTPNQLWLRQLAGNRPMVLRSNDFLTQCAAASAGLGIAVLPDFVARTAEPDLVEAEPGSFRRDAWIAFHRDLRGAPQIKATATLLATCLGKASAA